MESPAEALADDCLWRNGLELQRQYEVRDKRGRKYRLDLAIPELGIDLEIDGALGHSTAGERSADRERDARLFDRGWVTRRFGGYHAFNSRRFILESVRTLIAAQTKTLANRRR